MRAPLSLVVLLFLLSACGGRQYPNRTGLYRGPNVLAFTITAPQHQRMPDERNFGSAEVRETPDGRYLLLTLRIFDAGETPCEIHARRTGPGSLYVTGGQVCESHFVYDGASVAAEVRIEQGTGDFSPEGLRLQLAGPFVAERDGYAGPERFSGTATWSFVGQR